MKVLAVETSSSVAGVAVIEGTRLLGEYNLNHKKTHSQRLMPMIQEILGSLELTPEDIDIFAASSGPGSFTGLRIGVTTIKSIAYAVKKPVISVPTLDALAYNIPTYDGLICPIMDARNNQVYTAVYSREKGMNVKVTEYMGVPIDEIIQVVKGKNRKVIFAGDGVELHAEHILEELGELAEFALSGSLLPRASSVAYAAVMMANEGIVESCFEMAPFYLRKSQAEREYEKRQVKENHSPIVVPHQF